MGNISLRIILFSVLAKYRLIGRVWTFQFIQDHPLGLASQTFALGWYGGAWVLPWHTIPLGLASGIVSPFLYPHQLPPNPCVRIAWARAVILLITVAISTCLLGNGLIKA